MRHHMVAESFACKGQVAPSGGQVCNLGMFPWTILDEFSENFQTASERLPLPLPRFGKLCCAFCNETFRIALTPPPFSSDRLEQTSEIEIYCVLNIF